ncbi:UNVERIFIED_CONTAM: hypothetical protein NCL1_23250 [Trichonephila clavipes]
MLRGFPGKLGNPDDPSSRFLICDSLQLQKLVRLVYIVDGYWRWRANNVVDFGNDSGVILVFMVLRDFKGVICSLFTLRTF